MWYMSKFNYQFKVQKKNLNDLNKEYYKLKCLELFVSFISVCELKQYISLFYLRSSVCLPKLTKRKMSRRKRQASCLKSKRSIKTLKRIKLRKRKKSKKAPPQSGQKEKSIRRSQQKFWASLNWRLIHYLQFNKCYLSLSLLRAAKHNDITSFIDDSDDESCINPSQTDDDLYTDVSLHFSLQLCFTYFLYFAMCFFIFYFGICFCLF